MLAESHRADIGKGCFLEAEMAGGAAIGDLLFGNPDLLNARREMPLQSYGIDASADDVQILFLIMTPLAEEVFRRCNRQLHEKDDAARAESAGAVAEEEPPNGLKCLHRLLSPPGHHPGPAWATEKGPDRGEHNQLEQEPGHNPKREWALP